MQGEAASPDEQDRAGDHVRVADIKAITAPPPILESDDPYVKYWLGGFETMRSAIIRLLEMDSPADAEPKFKPEWSFTGTGAKYAKQ